MMGEKDGKSMGGLGKSCGDVYFRIRAFLGTSTIRILGRSKHHHCMDN